MSFLYPYVLIALLLPLLLAVLAILNHRQARQSWQLLIAPAHRAALVRKPPLWRTVLPAALGLLALTFGILAAARPINGYTDSGAVSSGRNLIIALDVSRSMETTDVTPSRLEEARTAAYELINALPTDKIGLIIFSGEADLVVPLTYDHDVLKETLYNVNRSWVATGGTNFGLVLKRAIKDFERSAPDGTNALVILSDGEDTVQTSTEAAKEARSKNLLVITVGIGTTAGGAIPDPRGQNGLWQDAQGKHVISKLNIENLQQFAQATGGDFFAMNSGTDLAAFAREAVNKLDRHEESFSAAKVPNDLYVWFTLPAMVLLLAAILLSTEWRNTGRITAVLLPLLLLAAAPQAAAAPSAESTLSYGIGYTLSREGEREKALEAYSQALLDEDPAMQAATHLAIGNMAANATFDKLRELYTPGDNGMPAQPGPKQLQEIVDRLKRDLQPYQDALQINPNFAPALQNVEKINTLIKKLEEEIERLKQQQQQVWCSVWAKSQL
ncbi:MAG: VWA domain-containing protein, partial [Akkermansia sp.]|nr:VWA domain-containing protein [Akkermansia sp.]